MITWNLVNFSALFRTALPRSFYFFANILSLMYFISPNLEFFALLTLFYWALHHYLLYCCIMHLALFITIMFTNTKLCHSSLSPYFPDDSLVLFWGKKENFWFFFRFAHHMTLMLIFARSFVLKMTDGQKSLQHHHTCLVRKQKQTFFHLVFFLCQHFFQWRRFQQKSSVSHPALLSKGLFVFLHK